MRRVTAILLCLSFAVLSAASTAARVVAADSYISITTRTDVDVVDVIDSDALVVRTTSGLALVRLIGVDAAAYTPGFEYLLGELKGAEITVSPDSFVSGGGRFNACYVYKGARFINRELLLQGLAKLNPEDKYAREYKNLSAAEATARLARLGLWANGGAAGTWAFARVNINTATAEQLRVALGLASSAVPNAIVAYRYGHPFESVSELKFVSGVTREMYARAYGGFSVCTDILTAPIEELLTLRAVDQTAAQTIIDYRNRGRIVTINDLYTTGALSSSVVGINRPFISITPTEKINYASPNFTVNINTATYTQLMTAGLSSYQAQAVINMRGGFRANSLCDFLGFGGLALSESAINQLADNFKVFTDINYASDYELRSLFGLWSATASDVTRAVAAIESNRPFVDIAGLREVISTSALNEIAQYIYVGEISYTAANANTASREALIARGLSASAASAVIAKRGAITTPAAMPSGARTAGLSMHTNVNTADYEELASLGDGFTAFVINAVIIYRLEQPFGSYAEFYDYLRELGAQGALAGLERFITVR